jgi:hypothetical protein
MDMGLKPSPDFMLVRRQKDRDYTPSNCEWGAVPGKQAKVRKSFSADRPADSRRHWPIWPNGLIEFASNRGNIAAEFGTTRTRRRMNRPL